MMVQLLAFECSYHSRQIAFRFAALSFFALGLICSSAALGGPEVMSNSPYTLTFVFIVLSMAGPILLALFAGNAILRDSDHGMAPILFCTDITAFQYLASRFFGQLLAAFLAFLPVLLGLLVGYYLLDRPPETIGPLLPGAYLWGLGLVVFPNLLMCAAITFATAALTRSALATYFSGLSLYLFNSLIGSLIAPPFSTTASSSARNLSSLLDPFGLTAFLNQTRYWSPLEKNLALPSMDGPLLLNRLLWIGLALLIFNLVSRRFSFRQEIQGKPPKMPTVERTEATPTDLFHPTTVTPYTLVGQVRAFLLATWLQIRQLATLKVTLLFSLVAGFFMIATLFESLRSSEAGVTQLATPAVVLPALFEQIQFFGPMVLIFLLAEILWRERQHRFHTITDALPFSNPLIWASKMTALACVILVSLSLTLVLTIAFLMIHGSSISHPQLLGLYLLKTLAYLGFLTVLTAFILVLIRQKYGALLVAFATLALFTPYLVPENLIPKHPLLQFGATSPFLVSSLTSSSAYPSATIWLFAYWAGISLILIALTLFFWPRGTERSNGPWQWPILGLLLSGASFSVIFGTYIVTQLDSNHLFPTDQPLRLKAAYEQTHGILKDKPQVSFSNLDLKVNLFPKTQTLNLDATVTLFNPHTTPLEEVFFTLPQHFHIQIMEIAGTHLIQQDFVHGVVQLEFDSPLLPQEERTMRFVGHKTFNPFQSLDPEAFLLPEVAYLELERFLPHPGYLARRQIQNTSQRLRFGLPPTEALPLPEAAKTRKEDRVMFRLTISTPTGLTAVGPGQRIAQRDENNRTISVFASNRPVPLALNLAIGHYSFRQTKVGDIPVTYFYPSSFPNHADGVLEAACKTLEYAQKHFGAYAGTSLTLALVPRFASKFMGTACPDTVFLNEDAVLLQTSGKHPLTSLIHLIAHEVSHQWWGMQLNPAEVQGVTFLLETLAMDTETMVANEMLGRKSTYRHFARSAENYALQRNIQDRAEQALALVEDQPAVYYYKGALIMHALRQLVGDTEVNDILKSLLENHPYPQTCTSEDLLTAILQKTPPASHHLISEWFEKVVTYQLRIGTVELQPVTEGLQDLEVTLHAHKSENTPNSTPLPLGQEVVLEFRYQGKRMSRQRIMMQHITQKLEMKLDHPVDELVLDPMFFWLDLQRADNHFHVTPEGAVSPFAR